MSKPKTVPKKLRDGPVIALDVQILRWRERLKKKGIKLGKNSEREDKRAEKRREDYALPAPEKRKWFE